jgi:hypothetical protein
MWTAAKGKDGYLINRMEPQKGAYLIMTFPMQQSPNYDTSARPGFRVIGALILVGVAVMFATKAVPLFSVAGGIVSSCVEETSLKSRLFCDGSAFLLSLLPAPAQGPTLGLATIGGSFVLLIFAWLLIKPLTKFSGKPADSKTKI